MLRYSSLYVRYSSLYVRYSSVIARILSFFFIITIPLKSLDPLSRAQFREMT